MTHNELDDLKAAWQTLNRNLERQQAFALQRFREKKRSRLRRGFRPLVIGQILQIVCGGLLALVGGSFWFDHLGAAHLMIYGAFIQLYGIMMIIFGVRDLILVRQLNYTAPVLLLQKQIAELRQWHRYTGLWFGVTSCLVWIPLLLMICHGWGVDVWRQNPQVVGWLLLSGFASVAILGALVAISQQPGRETFRRGLDNSTAGWTVRRAESLLEEIERFEND